MMHQLNVDRKELRFLRSAVENEQQRLLDEQKTLDEDDDDYSDLGNDAMLYQTLIDKMDAILLKL